MTKIDIFSGFLGAGKTTLIKKLIAEAYKGEKLVLIENEFGEIGIDGAFMQDAGIQVNEMNSGCICCSLVGDFGRALKKVLAEYAPDRILIEPSGVGTLSDVIGAVERIDSHDIELNSFTTVVDAKKAKVYMKNFGEFFNNQVESASAIILSRTQDVNEAKLSETLALLREHNPNAVIITTPWSELSGKTILAAMERRDTLEAALKELSEAAHEDDDECDDPECECHHHHHHDDDEDEDEHEHYHHHHDDDDDDHDEHEHHHHHDDDDDHDHDHEDHSHCDHEHGVCHCGHHHDKDHPHGDEYGISTFVFEDHRPLNREKFEAFLDDYPTSIIRTKGLLWFSDERSESYLFEQAGKQASAQNFGRWFAAESEAEQKRILAENPQLQKIWDEKYGDRIIRLVFIGQHMDKKAIIKVMKDCLDD